MKTNDRKRAKVGFLLTNLAIGWPVAFILEALVYYLAHRKADCSEMQFMLHMTLTVLAVSLVAAFFAARLVDSQVRSGLMPIDTYRRDQHLLIGIFPEALPGQIILTAVLNTIVFAFLSGGAAVLLAAGDHEISPIPGLVVCGVLSGLSVIGAAYDMMAARCATLEARDRRARRRKRRQTHDEVMEHTTVTPAPAEEADAEKKPKLNVPEFRIPKMTVTKTPEFRMPKLDDEEIPEEDPDEEETPEKTTPEKKVPEKKAPEKKAPEKKAPEKKAPQKTKTMSQPTRRIYTDDTVHLPDDIANETPTYSAGAKTGVLPDMSVLGLDFEDFDDFEEIDPQAEAHVVPPEEDDEDV